MPNLRPRPKQILIAVDQLCNTLFGGWADETFSARCWRLEPRSRGWAFLRRLVDGLFFLAPRHCEESYKSEAERAQCPAEYRPMAPREP